MVGNTIINKYETVIWDWNGTLLNDISLCVEIVNGMLKNHNDLQLDEAHYREVFGFPITSYYERIGIDLKKESFEKLTHTFISNYDSNVRNCELHEKVVDTLDVFQKNNLNQLILTAAHKESVLQLLGHFSISHYFDQIEGLDNHRAESKVERGKYLIERNNISKNKTVLIGDTIHDFEVANAIGVDCLLIANGHQSKTRLANNTMNQIEIINSIDELF